LISWVSAAGLALAVSATAQAQRGTLTPCKDGTTSTVSGRGACARHGGVDGEKLAAQKKAAEIQKARARKAEKAAVRTEREQRADARADAKADRKIEKKVEKREERAEAGMVRCTDGTLSKGGRGACSHHGGIAKAAKR
jgi:hypothetical protein